MQERKLGCLAARRSQHNDSDHPVHLQADLSHCLADMRSGRKFSLFFYFTLSERKLESVLLRVISIWPTVVAAIELI